MSSSLDASKLRTRPRGRHRARVEAWILGAVVVGFIVLITSRAQRATAQRAAIVRRFELEVWEQEERDHPFLTTCPAPTHGPIVEAESSVA